MIFRFDSIGTTPTEAELKAEITKALDSQDFMADEKKWLGIAHSCIDLTTLDGNDTTEAVENLCHKAKSLADPDKGIQPVAAVCVYSNFVSTARKSLEGTGISIASVAGGFPSGQGLIGSRVYDVKSAAEAGADEIDIVFPRGLLFKEAYQQILDELGMMRMACSGLKLKVILETGELRNALEICRAAELSILSGADFIKTSTGKTPTGATLESVYIMLKIIKAYFDLSGKKTGLKPSGGIAEPDNALQYLALTRFVAGGDWINNSLFRIGASRLADRIFERIA